MDLERIIQRLEADTSQFHAALRQPRGELYGLAALISAARRHPELLLLLGRVAPPRSCPCSSARLARDVQAAAQLEGWVVREGATLQ